MPNLYGPLETRGWKRCSLDPIKVNHSMVREFYDNATKTNFASYSVVTVRGKKVLFDPALINAYYGLPNANNQIHKETTKK